MIHVCILAAGQSKRFKSKFSKLLHPFCGRPLIAYATRTASELKPKTLGIVVGHQKEQIQNALSGNSVGFVEQSKQLGTAHAVSEFLQKYPHLEGTLLVMSGDVPLVSVRLLQNLLSLHEKKKAIISLLTAELNDPSGYGRIVRKKNGWIERIVEQADATGAEKEIREVNAGIYAFNLNPLRRLLQKVKSNNSQKEYYLTDVVELGLQNNGTVLGVPASAEEVMGINTKVELAEAARILRRRINERWMLQGVTMHDPERTYIDADVHLGNDVVIYPNVYLEGSTRIGSEVTIYPNTRIVNSTIGDRSIVHENCSVESSHLGSEVQLGPFARLRPESYLGNKARVGNFVELKKTRMGEGSKANHLSYLGDSTIGQKVNIGAGTITCNYDGQNKFPTVIEDGVFIGSDTQLIAPVKVGKDAYVAAGSSITEDVPSGALAISRGRQVNKPGWVAKKKKTTETRSHREKK